MIVDLFGTIPVIGPALVEWIRGDYGIADATLNRFFALHVVALPLALLLLVVLHLVALHEVGSNNPDGIEIKRSSGRRTASRSTASRSIPYYTVKDTFGLAVFLLLFCGDGVLRADLRRPVPRGAELRAGEPAHDAAAHLAGLVLHALLRDAARGAVVPGRRCGACW